MAEYKYLSDLRIGIWFVIYKTNALKNYHCDSRPSTGFSYYVRGGHTINFRNGRTLTTKPGSFLYLPRGCSYDSVRSDEATEYYQIEFNIYDGDKTVLPHPEPVVFDTPETGWMAQLCRRVYDDCLLPRETGRLTVLHDLTDIMALFLDNINVTQSAVSREYTDIAKTVAFIQVNYALNTTVQELAAISSMSVSAMEQRFRACFGRSPIDYRNGLRVENACRLLRGGFSIPDTAARVGFSDRYYFTRCFRKYAGVTPGMYIRQHKSEDTV